MKIEEFRIIHYGPLHDRGKITLNDFNLLYGVNETGKTLTLEALVKLLLGKKIKDFRNINRVDEEVDGYIIVEIDEEKKKLDRVTHLNDIAPVTTSECRNIFIIRNSDLSIESEASFYTEVTNRLTGLQTERINNLKEKILEISELTPGGDFSNRKEDRHLKTRIENAKLLLEEIEILTKEIEEEKTAGVEQEWINLFDEIKDKENLRTKLEEARKRITYENAASALSKIDAGRKALVDLSTFTGEDLNKWKDAEKEIKKAEKDLIELNEVLDKKGKELKNIEDGLKEKEREFEVIKKKKEKIDRLIHQLTDLENKHIELSSGKNLSLNSQSYFITVSAILACAILGLILNPSALFTGLVVVFAVFFFTLVALHFKSQKSKKLFKKHLAEFKMDMAEIGFKGETIEDFASEIEEFSFHSGKKESDINTKKIETGTINNIIKEITKKRIPELKGEIEKNTEIIHKIKSKTFVDNLKGFSENLKRKEKIEREIEKEESVLNEILGEGNRKERIKELENFKDSAKDVGFSEKEYDNLSKEIPFARKKLEEIEEKLNVLSEKFKQIERKSSNIFLDADLRCQGSRDLQNIKKEIKDFLKEKEISKKDAIVAAEILEDISSEEKTKIEEQFGENSPVSKYFSTMTEGLYTTVEFGKKEEKIIVTRKDNVKLLPWQLSGGTYDQLYFSIRLALAEKLFTEEKGFFILDDPFIKASHNRLKVLINMLKNISQKGWQIIYFSAKEEIREILGKDKEIKLIELESLL